MPQLANPDLITRVVSALRTDTISRKKSDFRSTDPPH